MPKPEIAATIELATPLPVVVGDPVKFTTEIDGHVKNPRIRVLAYQNDALVYGEAGGIDHTFQLGGNPDGGSIWTQNGGGPADCIAELYYFDKEQGRQVAVYLAQTGFHAD